MSVVVNIFWIDDIQEKVGLERIPPHLSIGQFLFQRIKQDLGRLDNQKKLKLIDVILKKWEKEGYHYELRRI